MVVSSIAFYHAKVSAAELTQDQVDSISGNGGSMTNMVLGSTATAYPGVAEGNINNLTNGSLTNGHCALSSGWGYSGEAYAILDLGDYYWANSLDEIVLTYKDVASNDTVVGRTYNIQYSVDLINWDTKYTSDTIQEADLLPNENNGRATIDDISEYTGKVKYVKIDYPSLPTYGIQLTEAAVLAEDPQLAPMETCDDPDAVTASSDNLHEITFNITAGEGQEGYVYAAFLDSINGQELNPACQAGVDYTYEVPGGNHTIFVQSHYNGAVSPGINSNQVIVNTLETLIDDDTYNFAFNKTYTLSSGSSTEGTGSITNGIIAGGNTDYVTPGRGDAGATDTWMCIDLGTDESGNLYQASRFETVAVWFRTSTGGCYPDNKDNMYIQYSSDGDNWTTLNTTINRPATSPAPFIASADVSEASGTVRYVRILFPGSVVYGAQVTEIGVFDLDNSSEIVEDPDSFTASSSTANTISCTIVGASGHSDYKYNVYLNDSLYLEEVDPGNHTINCIDAGTYDVKCRSVHNNHKSDGITVSNVVVASGFVYSSVFEAGVFPDSNTNGNNYVTQNGKTVTGVSATASEGTGGDAPAMAIDYNGGTRWGTSTSDPQWITVDLGAIRSVKEIGIWWETASSKDFVISVSTDGTNFQDVAFKNNAASGANRRDSFVLVNAVNARYVKIYGINRTTQWGHSIWEIAVYGSTPLHTITIDETEVGQVFDGGTYEFPGPGMVEYTEYGYYLTSDSTKVYAPQDEITVNSDLDFTGIDTVNVTHTNGATIHMVKTEPGIAFRATAQINGNAPIVNSAFTYGMLITPYDLFTEVYDEDLVIDNTENQVNVKITSASQMSSGTFTIGLIKLKQENLTRDFVSRGYVKINYVDGDSKVVYANNPVEDIRRRNIAQVARAMKNSAYYNTLEESEKEAVDYFATFE